MCSGCMVCRVVSCTVACVRVCSLYNNDIGDDGAVAIAGALAHVPQLTTLEYVPGLGLGFGCGVVCVHGVVGMWRLYRGVVLFFWSCCWCRCCSCCFGCLGKRMGRLFGFWGLQM